ncbi:hypothetical protein V3C99_016463 [Haemonchus contortus]
MLDFSSIFFHQEVLSRQSLKKSEGVYHPSQVYRRNLMGAGDVLRSMLHCILLHRPIFILSILLIVSSHEAVVKYHCRKVGAEEIIDERGCELMIVRVNRCSGHCLSFTFPNPITGKTSVHAKCCRMTDTEWVHAELMCDDGPRPIKIPSAVQCDCFDCAVQ